MKSRLKSLSARARTLLNRFSANRKGSVIVEFAMVVPLVSGLFLVAVDVGGVGLAKNKVSNALRFSTQYIANGGTELSIAESIFATNYGDGYESFTTSMSCACARSRTTYVVDPLQSEPAEDPDAEEETPNVSGSIAALPACTIDCGLSPQVRYINFEAEVAIATVLEDASQTIVERTSVRIE